MSAPEVNFREEKAHHGRIKDWRKERCDGGLGFQIVGHFLDHPLFRGPDCHTSFVIAHDEATGEIETRNSRYTLVADGEEGRIPGFAMIGEKVCFLGKNGYEHEVPDAIKKGLVVGEEYTITDMRVGEWSSSYEFGPLGWHNTVMFGLPEDARTSRREDTA